MGSISTVKLTLTEIGPGESAFADTGRLNGCVQELNCLSTTHKEK
jgi:hypothetical protein